MLASGIDGEARALFVQLVCACVFCPESQNVQGDAGKRALAHGLDGNTRALFGQLAEVSCDAVFEHMRHFQYSPVGGLQLMRDLGAWKQLSATLLSPEVERWACRSVLW